MSFLTDIVTSKEKEPEKVKKYNLQFKEDDKIIYINCCGKGFAILESTVKNLKNFNHRLKISEAPNFSVY